VGEGVLLSSLPSGQQRSKMLATLFKDERCQALPAFNILEKMYVGAWEFCDQGEDLKKKIIFVVLAGI